MSVCNHVIDSAWAYVCEEAERMSTSKSTEVNSHNWVIQWPILVSSQDVWCLRKWTSLPPYELWGSRKRQILLSLTFTCKDK